MTDNATLSSNASSLQRSVDPQLIAEVKAGLRASPKTISSVWFYDEAGSLLFDAICELPEYYPTRTELSIMQAHAPEMAVLIGKHAALIEYGSGTSLKTRLLLDLLPAHTAYVPVDIARTHLRRAAASIAHDYPQLDVVPVYADFTSAFTLPRNFEKHVVYFPGSTLGNFDSGAACSLLSNIRKIIARNGALLIGIDLRKDTDTLIRAYDDAAGITADFNLNALKHLNRQLGANFDVNAFFHRAVWVDEFSRIEMHLVSTRDQVVTVDGETFPISRGEHLHTESSHKYTLDGFASLARSVGLRVKKVWLDDKQDFSVQWLEPMNA